MQESAPSRHGAGDDADQGGLRQRLCRDKRALSGQLVVELAEGGDARRGHAAALDEQGRRMGQQVPCDAPSELAAGSRKRRPEQDFAQQEWGHECVPNMAVTQPQVGIGHDAADVLGRFDLAGLAVGVMRDHGRRTIAQNPALGAEPVGQLDILAVEKNSFVITAHSGKGLTTQQHAGMGGPARFPRNGMVVLGMLVGHLAQFPAAGFGRVGLGVGHERGDGVLVKFNVRIGDQDEVGPAQGRRPVLAGPEAGVR